jgi:hypothetical protein
MPKQIHTIQAFHGGLNTGSDPRDIDNTELSGSTDLMVDELGKVRMMGGTANHDATPSTAIAIEPGYGLFQFSHDRKGAHVVNADLSGTHTGGDHSTIMTDSAGTFPVDALIGATINNTTDGSSGTITDNDGTTVTVGSLTGGLDNSWDDATNDAYTITNFPETGDDYLALADDESSDPAVYIYSRTNDKWSGTQTITLGDTDNPKTSFYSVDGSLRISDGNFGADNVNKWYGYIDRTLFKDLTPSYEINQWYESTQEVKKPNSSYFDDDKEFSGAYGSVDTTTGSTSSDAISETRANIASNSVANVIKAEVDWQVVIAGIGATNVAQVITCGVYEGSAFTSTADSQTVLSGWQYGGTYTGTATFYFDEASTVTGTGGPHGDWDAFRSEFTVDIGDSSHGITAMRLSESAPMTDLSGTNELSNNNVFIEYDWETNTGASGWNEGGTGKWEVGVSFIYDGLQESQITTCGDVAAPSTTTLTVPGSDTTNAPNIRIYFADWATVTSGWNKRISGCNLYMKDVSESTTKSWFLQVSMNFETGKALVASTQKEFDAKYYAQSNQEYYYWEIGSATGTTNESEMLEPSLITTYEVTSGQNASEESIISQYRSAVVVGRRVYIGGLNVEKAIDGSREVMTDAMIKSPVNNFDIFPLSRMVEASVQDGDEIIKLEEYADRILQFKKNKMHLINVSQEIEFLEDTFLHKGVSHPAAVCKTDFGVAWVNNLGCYLYDGQKVHNLLEKGGRQIIKESDWITFNANEPMIIYIPKKRQLLIANDITTTGDGSTFLYDMVTQSWVKGAAATITSEDKTNFVTDWNGDPVYVHSVGTILKWDDASDASSNFSLLTKDFDFGQPGQRKKIHKVYLTFRGNGTHVQVHYGVDGVAPASTFYPITSGTDGSTTGTGAAAKCIAYDAGTNDWLKAELKPGSAVNNVSSFRLKISGDGSNNIAADFEINDISIVYRMKHIK